MYFAKDENGILHKIRDDGSTRSVPADDPCYLSWLDGGGVLGEVPVAAPPTLAEAKAAACARIEDERQRRLSAGVLINWPDGVLSRVQTRDLSDWFNINSIAAAGLAATIQGVDPGLYFRDADNANHALTPTQAVDFGFQAVAAGQALAKTAHDAKDAITAPAVTTTAQIAEIEAGVVWPG